MIDNKVELMANGHEFDTESIYTIRVRGSINSDMDEWFVGFDVEPLSQNEIVITGPILDQAALHGFLAVLSNLGLTLVHVERQANN